MIFFNEDWNRYPTAIADDSTKNLSWLRYASLLKKMGITNCYFPLALIDPGLKGIDPFAPDITEDLARRVITECSDNVWYFLREIVRVPAKASPFPSLYEANRGNVALNFMALNDIDVAITQIRQTGKTLGCNVTISYVALLKVMNTTIQLMTRNAKLRSENVMALKEIRKLLPAYIANIRKDDSDNTEGVTYKAMNNKIITALPQKNPDDATGAGRGFTSPIIMIDESAFCDNIQHSYPSMMSSSNAACDEARRFGMPTFKLFPCTAGDKGREEGAFMYDKYHSVARFCEHFFDCKDKAELQETVRANSKDRRLMVYIEFNHRQLGKSDEWLYDKIVESGGSQDEINRDYFNQWTSGSGASPLDPLVREAINKSKVDPMWVERNKDNFIVKWYISEQEVERCVREDVKFIIGMDTSEGLGMDQMTMVFINEQTLETVATCCISEVVNTIRFGEFVCDILLRYPNTVLIPERRSTGIVIIDHLLIQLPMAGIDPFTRVYNKAVDGGDIPENIREVYKLPMNRRSNKDYESCKKYFGYATSKSGENSRSALYSLSLTRMSNYASDMVRDSGLIDELMSLVVSEGRIDHVASGHDDNVIAWLLAGWLLNFGRNLSAYGICNPLMKVTSFKDRNNKEIVTKKQQFEKDTQAKLKAALANLIHTLSGTEGDMEAILIEKQIRRLNSKIHHTVKLPMSVDELVKEAHNVRRNRFLGTKVR